MIQEVDKKYITEISPDFIYNRFIPNARNNVCTETNKGDYADGCTWKIMRNGWKIPDDYPVKKW